MALVIPPSSAGASAAVVTTTVQTSVAATAPDAPPAAARLEAGSIITGTVLGRDAQGLVNIRTDKGVLALQTHANLPPGSTVSLEVRVAGSRLQLVVLSVELPPGQQPAPGTGAPTGGALPGNTTPGGTPPGGTPAPPSTAPAPLPLPLTPSASLAMALTGGKVIIATVVHGGTPPPGGALPGAVPTGPQGGMIPQPPVPGVPGQAAPGSVQPGTASPIQTLPAPPVPGASGPGQAPSAQPIPGAALAGHAPIPGGGVPTAGTPLPGGGTAPIVNPGSAATGAPQPGAPVAGTPPPLPGAGIPTAAPVATPSPAPLNPGAAIGVRILGAALPGEPAPTAGMRPPGAPPVVPGTVVAQTPAGQPIVETPAGALVMAVKGALPVGSTLLIEIPPQPMPLDPTLGLPVNSPQQALLRLFRGWPTLGSVMAALDSAGDLASVQTLAAKLPQTGPTLARGLLSLIAQLNIGDGAEFLSPALREALERIGKRDLADRLNGEFRQISRLAGEPGGGDWRVMFLPLRHEGELHQVNLYLRGRRRNGDKDDPDTGTRFIVEVDMTRLGPIQLDGLVHGRRFDLMLRSRVPLSPGVRRDIESIFEEARGLGGFAGAIGFQIAASFPVQPLEQAKRKQAAAGVVV